METLLTSRSIGISDLRDAPARAFAQAENEAIVVLNHNKPAGYILSNAMMASLLYQLSDRLIADRAAARLPSLHKARKITLDEL